MDSLSALRAACEHCTIAIRGVPLPLFLSFILVTFLGFAVLGYSFLVLFAPVPRNPLPDEKKYQAISEDGLITAPQQLPCWHDKLKHAKETRMEDPELFMSVVIPAYNEEKRLLGMLEEAVHYLEHAYGTLASQPLKNDKDRAVKSSALDSPQLEAGNQRRKRKGNNTKANANGSAGEPLPQAEKATQKGWEILLVSDGSTDKTVLTALNFAKDHQLSIHPKEHAGPWSTAAREGVRIPPGTIRIVQLKYNRGKGGAVTHGMRHVRGQYAVFADADGASDFTHLGKLVDACQDSEDSESRAVAVGSRAHLVGSDAVVKRSKLRNFLMHSFHLALRLLTPPATARIRDTQCGFKLFSRASLPYIIPYMHSEGWIFDVEMLMLAEYAGIPVVEVPVGWREVQGSKLNVVWDSLGMAWGLAMLRAAWGLGVYRRSGA